MSFMERYDRNSTQGLNMTTVNPCNNFIIDYLIRNKIKSDKQVSSKYYMYNLAIQSVRKYPLPLVCEEQLAALEGFGNFFISRVAKVIKRHYIRGRMATLQQMDEDDKQHLEVIKETYRKLDEKFDQRKKQKDQQIEQYREREKYVAKITSKNNQQINKSEIQPNSEQKKILYQESFSYSQQEEKQNKYSNNYVQKSEEALKFQRIMTEKSYYKYQQEKNSYQKDARDNQDSNSTKRKRNYRPRKGTQPYQILKALIKLKADKKPVTRGGINQFMFNQRKQKMKGWTPVKNRLIQFGYIRLNQSNFEQIYLTEKGKDYVLQIQQNGQNQEDYYKTQMQDESNKQYSSENDDRERKQKKKFRDSKQKKKAKRYSLNKNGKLSGVHYQKVKYRTQFKMKKEQLSLGKVYKQASLIFNDGSEINTKDYERILQLFEKKNMKYKEQRLLLGQFAWQIGQTLLDFLVFRFKYDQFDIDEYILTCQRARYSQCDNIYIIFEQPLTKVKGIQDKQKLVNNIIAQSRVSGMRVLKTKGISQTLSFLGKLTSELNQKIKSLVTFTNIRPIFFMASIEQFNEYLKKFKPALFRNVAVHCLRRVPGITKNMIKKIIRKMPGLWFIYKKLKQLKSNSERKRFLHWYLQSEQPKKGTVRFIVDLMFYDDYDEV